MSPSVAVVILNYNGKKHLEQFLPSVMATNYLNLQIIVADNGSTDDSIEFVQRNFPHIKILDHHLNEGFAGGYNWALKRVEADYYVLLNSDVEVTNDWVTPVIELMEKDKNIAAAQPKMLSFKDPDSFEYAGAAGGWIDKLGYPFSRGRIFDICETDEGQYNQSEPIFWASGAAMFVRASVFHEMKGFDPYFFAHQEEIDLCWRMQLAGYTIMACPDSAVYHVGGGTLPRGGRKVFLNFRNNLIMLAKNLPFGELIWKLPMRFFLDAVSAWKGLLTGDIYFFTAIMKAHFAFGRWFLCRYAGINKVTKPMHTLNGVYTGSVVWNYFVENKKRFLEIISTRR
ncbi:glycosyltransferase family 2 protein [Sediminibacterium sp. C3]|uniref:glycosyltransferase family 2 protein n=1 Tax=Sediminibacterium sp. C3 TaxID=1267211 RepID=UPI000426D6B4|nr:glycosyltransferase family 2 protein [Sediminibacterium sp. C3]